MIYLSKRKPLNLPRAQTSNMATNDHYFQAHNTVNQIITALENVTDLLEIDGLLLRLDYLIRTLVNLYNFPQKEEIIRLLGEASNQLTTIPTESNGLIDVQPVEFAPQVFNQRRGRPAFEIKEDQLAVMLRNLVFIAHFFFINYYFLFSVIFIVIPEGSRSISEFPDAWGGKKSMPPVGRVWIFSGTTH